MWHVQEVGRAAHMHHGAGGVAPPPMIAAAAPVAAMAVTRLVAAAAVQAGRLGCCLCCRICCKDVHLAASCDEGCRKAGRAAKVQVHIAGQHVAEGIALVDRLRPCKSRRSNADASSPDGYPWTMSTAELPVPAQQRGAHQASAGWHGRHAPMRHGRWCLAARSAHSPPGATCRRLC